MTAAPPKAIELAEDGADVAATNALAAGFASLSVHGDALNSSAALVRRASAELLGKTPLALLARARFEHGANAAGAGGGGGGGGEFRLSSLHIARSGALLLAPAGSGVRGAGPSAVEALHRSFSRLSLQQQQMQQQQQQQLGPALTSRLPRSVAAIQATAAAAGGSEKILLDMTTVGPAAAAPAPAGSDDNGSGSGAGATAGVGEKAKRVTFEVGNDDDDEDVDAGAGYAGAASGEEDDVANRRDIYAGDEGAYAGYGDYDGGMVADRDAAAAGEGEGGAGAVGASTRRSSRLASSSSSSAANSEGGDGGEDDEDPEAAARAASDPWLQLDPDACDPSSVKPYKKGRTYMVLRDPGSIAKLGVYGAAALALQQAATEAANTSSSGAKGSSSAAAAARDARALMTKAKALAAKAAALRASAPLLPFPSPSNHASAASYSSALAGGRGTPAAALALAAATETINHSLGASIFRSQQSTSSSNESSSAEGRQQLLLSSSSFFSLPLTPASLASNIPLFPEAEPLYRNQRAAAAKARLVAHRRSSSRSKAAQQSLEAAIAGGAYGLGGGGEDDDNNDVTVAAGRTDVRSGNAIDQPDEDDVASRRDIYAGDEGAYAGYGDYDGGLVADRDAADADGVASDAASGGLRDRYGRPLYTADGGSAAALSEDIGDPLEWLNDPEAQLRSSSGGAQPPSASKAAARRALLAQLGYGASAAGGSGVSTMDLDGSLSLAGGGAEVDYAVMVARYMADIVSHLIF